MRFLMQAYLTAVMAANRMEDSVCPMAAAVMVVTHTAVSVVLVMVVATRL